MSCVEREWETERYREKIGEKIGAFQEGIDSKECVKEWQHATRRICEISHLTTKRFRNQLDLIFCKVAEWIRVLRERERRDDGEVVIMTMPTNHTCSLRRDNDFNKEKRNLTVLCCWFFFLSDWFQKCPTSLTLYWITARKKINDRKLRNLTLSELVRCLWEGEENTTNHHISTFNKIF